MTPTGFIPGQYPCPACGAPADLATGCSGCGRPPDAEAAEVIALIGVTGQLTEEVESARAAYQGAVERLKAAVSRRDALSFGITARLAAERSGVEPTPQPAIAARPETSGRTAQNILFILGGLLLGSAAIVFAAVAWATVGVIGRAVVLAILTVLTLAVPPLAQVRRLGGTAETFAALGLLLVLLDGYAAWYVNLAGIHALPTTRYAGAVAAVAAAVALGYGLATGLAAPLLAALLMAQPALPLLLAPARLGPAGWAGAYAVLALANLAVIRWATRRLLIRIPAGLLAGLATLVGLGCAGVAMASFDLIADAPPGRQALVTGAIRAGAALVLVAATTLPAADLTSVVALRTGARGTVAFALVIATGKILEAAWPALIDDLLPTAVLLLAVGGRLLARRVGPGPGFGVLVAAGIIAAVDVVRALFAGARTMSAALPAWRADPHPVGGPLHWGLPASLVLIALAVAVLAPKVATVEVPAVAGGLLALAIPAALALPWWAPPVSDAVVALPLAVAAALSRTGRRVLVFATAAALLGTHAAIAALTTRTATVSTLAVVLVAAVTCALTGRHTAGRLLAWVVAVAGAAGLALATALATGVSRHPAALWMLAAATLALAASAASAAKPAAATAAAQPTPAGTATAARALTEAGVIEAAAHTAAFVALLVAVGSLAHTAGVCALWGLAVGVRALWPAGSVRGRRVRITTALTAELLATWLLLAATEVSVLEAYTVPAAALAALAGFLASRRRPELTSWTAYGPALVVGLGPSLVTVLVEAGQPGRRLALGMVALTAVILGTIRRRQAPVVIGGVVLVAIALHEAVLLRDLLPRWTPLALGGLLLVGTAITYERRRRDVARLRAAVSGMR